MLLIAVACSEIFESFWNHSCVRRLQFQCGKGPNLHLSVPPAQCGQVPECVSAKAPKPQSGAECQELGLGRPLR